MGNEELAYSGHRSEQIEKDYVGSQGPQHTVVLEEERKRNTWEEEEEKKMEEEERKRRRRGRRRGRGIHERRRRRRRWRRRGRRKEGGGRGREITIAKRNFCLTYIYIYLFCVKIYIATQSFRLSRWPSGLKRGSAAARLPELRVRIPLGAWISLLCCRLGVSASGWSPVQSSPIDCGVSECDREASIMRRPLNTRDWSAMLSEGSQIFLCWQKKNKLLVEFDLTPRSFTDIPIHDTLKKEAVGSCKTFILIYQTAS